MPSGRTRRPLGPRRSAGRPRVSGSYVRVLTDPVVRRLLPGVAVSYLGDGMSAVAIAWLALRLAPASEQGWWVGLAVAAYSVPGALGAALFGRFLRDRDGAQLAAWDATLRAVALGAIPLVSMAGLLDEWVYVALLAVSSLLHAWGIAGSYTLLATVLDEEHRLAGNALLSSLSQLATIVGPAVAGVLVAVTGAPVVIGVDAATFALLALSYALVRHRLAPVRRATPSRRPRRGAGLRLIASDRRLLGLLVLTFLFYFLYGPVEVALPVHVASDLHGSAGVLGSFWALFGVGAVFGAFGAGTARRWRLWPTMTGIVIGWGVGLIPLGTHLPTDVALAGFALGGLIFGPYAAVSMALFQRSCPPDELAGVLAARSALLVLASPVGTALGGPLVASFGARSTLLLSAVTTIALGVITAAAVLRGHLARRGPRPGSGETDQAVQSGRLPR